jgi:sigma-B regulation protein RsbU (phosphoserine phosphatase)
VFDRLTVDFAVSLERDDCLVLYTDGVTEALNTEGDEFGVDRLLHSVRSSAKDGAQAIVKKIIQDVRDFTGSAPQNDDMTLIAIRKT